MMPKWQSAAAGWPKGKGMLISATSLFVDGPKSAGVGFAHGSLPAARS